MPDVELIEPRQQRGYVLQSYVGQGTPRPQGATFWVTQPGDRMNLDDAGAALLGARDRSPGVDPRRFRIYRP